MLKSRQQSDIKGGSVDGGIAKVIVVKLKSGWKSSENIHFSFSQRTFAVSVENFLNWVS